MSGLVINTNTAANIAALDLDNNNTALQSSLQKLSSGLQINSAADNPAGLVISQQFQAQIAGVTQATSNDQQAINMVQTGEGALDEMNNLLNSARQLAVDAANTALPTRPSSTTSTPRSTASPRTPSSTPRTCSMARCRTRRSSTPRRSPTSPAPA